MTKKFKKHKFIPKEKFASLLGMHDVNFRYYQVDDNGNYEEEWIVRITDFHRVGYGQHVIAQKDKKLGFNLRYTELKEDTISKMLFNTPLPIEKFFSLHPSFSDKGYTKVKPIYKVYNYYSGELMDCEGIAIPSARYEVFLEGILLK